MTNAYQVYTAARQLLEGYTAAMQPLCRREGLAPNGVDILLFLANNPGLDTARDVCTYPIQASDEGIEILFGFIGISF